MLTDQARTAPVIAPGPAESPATFAGGESLRALTARTWAADAALGAGLVLFALGSEHLRDHVAIAALLVLLGAAETLWAVAALRGPAPLRRTALAVLLCGAGGWVFVQPATGTAIGVADAAVVALQLSAALLVAAQLHGCRERPARSSCPVRPARRLGAGRQLGVMAAGAALFAIMTVPGLAATEAGAHAVPHSEHDISLFGGGHHHG